MTIKLPYELLNPCSSFTCSQTSNGLVGWHLLMEHILSITGVDGEEQHGDYVVSMRTEIFIPV